MQIINLTGLKLGHGHEAGQMHEAELSYGHEAGQSYMPALEFSYGREAG